LTQDEYLADRFCGRQCLTFNPPSDDQFDSALLSAPVSSLFELATIIAVSAEDKLKELNSLAR
jgi:hypothetical protein